MWMQIVTLMSWAAIPVTFITVLDDWFRRPYRQIAAAPQRAPDPPVLTLLYYVVPLFVAAGVIRLLAAERLDFSAVLLAISVVTGVVWVLDVLFFRRLRVAAAQAAGKDFASIPEPGTVDYARSFFPVALVVLVLRAFIFEPFRIPSDSMMPTLVDGDFIIVNKYAYGLRLPVLNRKIVAIGEPQRGDVVVFRFPVDPSVNFIKRLVGLPGDHIEVDHDRITVNGKPVPFNVVAPYNDGCYVSFQLATEKLGEHEHQAMLCPVRWESTPEPLPGCNRKETRGYICPSQGDASSLLDGGDREKFSKTVPPGQYFMMGDNRDNSDDGRSWGFVPEDNLVGKATRIWFNWDLGRTGGPAWSRIGTAIK
jgi:signal peptidase I